MPSERQREKTGNDSASCNHSTRPRSLANCHTDLSPFACSSGVRPKHNPNLGQPHLRSHRRDQRDSLLAEDAKLFEKYGLDTEVVHARGAVPVQALVSGSVEFGAFSGSSSIAATLAGSDIVFVAAKGNYAVMSFWVRRDSPIKTLADLRGKTIGVTRAGSATHMIARLAFKAAGITERDVKFLHHGGLPESFLFLDKGLVHPTQGSPPMTGERQLVVLSQLKIPILLRALAFPS